MLTGFSPENGGLPATISYNTMPSEYRSLRGSGCAPWACSGEKYVAVPITEPTWVRLFSLGAFIARAMPKSATFTWPLAPMRMLAGLMSRCTTPLRVGDAERGGDLVGDLGRLHRVDVPVGPQDVGQRAALHVLHRHEVGVGVLAPVVDGDDVGVGQVGRRLGLAAEPLDEVRVGGELGEQHLDGDQTVEQQVARQEDVGHAAAPDALLDFVAVVEDRPLAVVCHVLPTLLSCASNAPRGYLRKVVHLASPAVTSRGHPPAAVGWANR